jgi:hypothetical protein
MIILALIGFPMTSDAGRPGKTCSQVCSRVSSCKLLSYDLCMDMCGQQGAEDTPESRASNLAQAKLSCSALADQMAPSQWLCTAEGASSYGYGMDTGSMADVRGTQGIHMLGTGKTRGAAVYKALSDCNSIMTVQLNNQRLMNLDTDAQGEWGAAITSECHITQCIAPASARKKPPR